MCCSTEVQVFVGNVFGRYVFFCEMLKIRFKKFYKIQLKVTEGNVTIIAFKKFSFFMK
jgi:hypothetical protein